MFECRGLTKVYQKTPEHPGFTALQGLDLTVASGEFLAVTGPSGCGKSTLLHVLGALDRPTAGRCLIDGKDTARLSDAELSALRGAKIGFVFQAFNLLPRLSAVDNVALPMVYARMPREQRHGRARSLLEEVGLGSKVRCTPLELSGGERQRVAIARALANDPPALLADEPTGNLDTVTGQGILDLFERLHRGGRTLVLVTHDPGIARRAQRLIAMKDGRVVQ